MSEFKKGIGSWDDDFDDNWHGDNPPQPKEDPNELKDTSIMQWGNDHKGKPMSKVPSKYLLWYYENVRYIDPRLKKYIEDNLDSIKQEVSIRK